MRLFNQFKAIVQRSPQGLNSFEFIVGLKSDLGCHRAVNEDCIYCSLPSNNQQSTLAIAADGMGGHNAGETASREASQAIQTHFFASRYFDNPAKSLKNAVVAANSRVYQLACQDISLSGMGTTVTALAIVKGLAYFAHVGDSRLYLFRDGKLRQLTQDHTLVAKMLKDGLITQEQAKNHPDRNIINRSIGTKPEEEIDVLKVPIRVQANDIFLLCTDGLYDLVPDYEIANTISHHAPDEACHLLIETARSYGGYDNISVIIVKAESPVIASIKPAITRY